jgi:hypothetical protein
MLQVFVHLATKRVSQAIVTAAPTVYMKPRLYV